MGSWPMSDGMSGAYFPTGASYSATVSAGGTANTKGVWAELVASLANPSPGFLCVFPSRGNGALFLVDIGIGAVDAEVVIVSNLHLCAATTGTSRVPEYFWVPLRIASGTRISARCQSSLVSASMEAGIWVTRAGVAGMPLFGQATTYGAATGTSRGTQIDPGGTANTKGTPVELSASTTAPIRGAVLCLGNNNNTTDAIAGFLLDIMVGAAGVEVVAAADLLFHSSSALDGKFRPAYYLSMDVPAGTRLSARAQCTHTDATDRLFDLTLTGFH